MKQIKLPTKIRLKIAMYRFIFLIVASIFVFDTVYAQNKKISPDSLKKQLSDSLAVLKKAQKPFKFTVDGIRVGFDLSYPTTDNLFSPFQNSIPIPNATPVAPSYKYRYEGTADISFAQNRFFAVFDYGFSRVERDRKGLNFTGFSYSSQGSYFRLGADYNFMHRTFKDEAMFVGFRYAVTSFKHNFTYYGASEAWGYRPPRLIESTATIVDDHRFVGNISEVGLSATWLEIVLGLKVNVWKQLFMGYTARLMLLSKVKGENQLIANDLPGFGSTNKQGRVVLNYYISYRIAFKTKAKIPRSGEPPLLKKSVEGKTTDK